jgi:hypothetical protein
MRYMNLFGSHDVSYVTTYCNVIWRMHSVRAKLQPSLIAAWNCTGTVFQYYYYLSVSVPFPVQSHV